MERDTAVTERKQAQAELDQALTTNRELEVEMRVIVTRMALASIVAKVVWGPTPSAAISHITEDPTAAPVSGHALTSDLDDQVLASEASGSVISNPDDGASASGSSTSSTSPASSATSASSIPSAPSPPSDWPQEAKDDFEILYSRQMVALTKARNAAAHASPLSRVHAVVERGPVEGRTNVLQLRLVKSRCQRWTGLTWTEVATSQMIVSDRGEEVKQRRIAGEVPGAIGARRLVWVMLLV